MTQTFKVGDRVRVMNVPDHEFYSKFNGQKGKIVRDNYSDGFDVDLDRVGIRFFHTRELELKDRTTFDIALSEKQLRILIDLLNDRPNGDINDPDVPPVAGEVQKYTYTLADRNEIHHVLISAGIEEDSNE